MNRQNVGRRIRSFAKMDDGWHFGEGIGATEAAVESALAITELLADYQAQDIEVFPCVDGGILVHGYYGSDVLEIQCNPDNSIHLAHERDGDLVEERDSVSQHDIDSYLGELAWVSIVSSEFYTRNTTAPGWVGLPAPPSSRHRQTKGSQCLMQSAEQKAVARNASTFTAIIVETTPFPSSIGDFAYPFCPQNAVLNLRLQQVATIAIATSRA